MSLLLIASYELKAMMFFNNTTLLSTQDFCTCGKASSGKQASQLHCIVLQNKHCSKGVKTGGPHPCCDISFCNAFFSTLALSPASQILFMPQCTTFRICEENLYDEPEFQFLHRHRKLKQDTTIFSSKQSCEKAIYAVQPKF